MAKRFTDSDKWKKPWFRALSPSMKAFWIYLCDFCDAAGVWDVDFETASYFLGQPVTREDFDSLVGSKVIWLEHDKVFIPSFVEFQYGDLEPACKPHAAVIKTLRRHGIDPVTLELIPSTVRVIPTEGTHSEGYPKGIQTLKDKDKSKDKDKEKGGVGENKPAQVPRSHPVSPALIDEAMAEWAKALAPKNRKPHPERDRLKLARQIQRRGHDRLMNALRGYRAEKPGKGYDPGNFLNLNRLEDEAKFCHLEALGEGFTDKPKRESALTDEEFARLNALPTQEAS